MWKRLRRNARWWRQRRTRGWDEREVWSLDHTAAKFLAPRVEMLRDQMCGYPIQLDEETWFAILDKMAQAFRFVEADEWILDGPEAEREAKSRYIDDGLELFAEFFLDLWN